MNLVIDIGNTLTKIAIFNGDKMVALKTLEPDQLFNIDSVLVNQPDIDRCIVSSVSINEEEIISQLKNRKIHTIEINEKTPLPFANKYKTPGTLGKDRIAAVAGAYKLNSGKNVLVVDAGTAIKFDVKNNKDEYLGGNISPGLEMRFKALNHFTARLPLLKPEKEFSLIGQSTNEAIVNGVQNGLIFEVEGYIKKLKDEYPELIIIVTGGDAQFFEYMLKKTIFVVANLTLIGLNTILEYNVQTN
jgi:type III pantothenate kinase